MSSFLKKIKKENHLLTDIELENYRLECIELQKKCNDICSNKIVTKDNMELLLKYGKRLKEIKKILKKALKKVGN